MADKVNKTSELVPLGTNVLTLAPGRYMVDGLTTETEAMHLPEPAWHYEIDVLASENIAGLINNHKVIIAYPISTGDQYINTMDYNGNWTGWMKTPTMGDLLNKVNIAALTNVDLNTITADGHYRLNGGCTNVPVTGGGWEQWTQVLVIQGLNSDNATQIMPIYWTGDVWIRTTKATGTWTEWKCLATATKPEEHYLPLSEGVSAIQKNYYLKRQDSCVEVRFSVAFPPTDGRIKVIAALPAGYLPDNTETDSCTAIEAVGDGMGAAKVEVLSDGVVQIYANAAGAIGAAGSIVFTATH